MGEPLIALVRSRLRRLGTLREELPVSLELDLENVLVVSKVDFIKDGTLLGAADGLSLDDAVATEVARQRPAHRARQPRSVDGAFGLHPAPRGVELGGYFHAP